MTRRNKNGFVTVVALTIALIACSSGGSGSQPAVTPAVVFTAVASGVAAPTAITAAGAGSGRLFLAQQGGQVRILNAGTLLPTAFLDIADRALAGGERGLLGLAFPPDYDLSGVFYVCYTRSPDGASVISRFSVSADADIALAGSEDVLLVVAQPFSNHNGGQLAFGPDGYLYIGLGDGGSAGDPQGNAQNPDSLLGKILRIDVDPAATPYAVPADNPFVTDPAWRDEIWAAGLRNPWRFSFDRANGDLYIADVGQNSWEEVNFQPASSLGGENYEWNVREGPDCFNPATGCVPPPAAVAPVAVYDHASGCSVTGGAVYRGPGLPAIAGQYIYGDFCSGRIWGLDRNGAAWESQVIADSGFSISAFGEDEQGRLYVADYATGTIYRIDQP